MSLIRYHLQDLQDFDHSDRPLKKRIFYWPTLVVVRAAEYAGKVRFSTRRQFWKVSSVLKRTHAETNDELQRCQN